MFLMNYDDTWLYLKFYQKQIFSPLKFIFMHMFRKYFKIIKITFETHLYSLEINLIFNFNKTDNFNNFRIIQTNTIK